MYLNTIFLGYNSYGVQTAAMQYFDKDVSQLDLAESAVLAGLTNNPSIYDVYNHPEKVKERQETILHRCVRSEDDLAGGVRGCRSRGVEPPLPTRSISRRSGPPTATIG